MGQRANPRPDAMTEQRGSSAITAMPVALLTCRKKHDYLSFNWVCCTDIFRGSGDDDEQLALIMVDPGIERSGIVLQHDAHKLNVRPGFRACSGRGAVRGSRRRDFSCGRRGLLPRHGLWGDEKLTP